MNKFDNWFAFHKAIMAIVIILTVVVMLWRGTMVVNAIQSDTPLYEVSVNRLNESEVYLTSEYERDQTTGCIKFKDEFGINRIVCNQYTITEYNK